MSLRSLGLSTVRTSQNNAGASQQGSPWQHLAGSPGVAAPAGGEAALQSAALPLPAVPSGRPKCWLARALWVQAVAVLWRRRQMQWLLASQHAAAAGSSVLEAAAAQGRRHFQPPVAVPGRAALPERRRPPAATPAERCDAEVEPERVSGNSAKPQGRKAARPQALPLRCPARPLPTIFQRLQGAIRR